jgi:putative transposase
MVTLESLAQEVGVAPACRALEVGRASMYRFRRPAPQCVGVARGRGEPGAVALPSPRSLTPSERDRVLEVLHSERFVDQAPPSVYATLLDEGRYLCSVRTMYRLLDDHQEVQERRNQARHPHHRKPELVATGPNQVWSWDITKLLGPQKWTYYYLYVILDVFSRYVPGWMLAMREGADLAQRFLRETADKEQILADQLTLHSDRGPAMKSHTVAQLLATLGVTKSHTRPDCPTDNPFSESQFKTMKYRPDFPERFASHETGLEFCREFFHWYNHEHYHSGIALLTPAMVHHGHAPTILANRHKTLSAAYAAHPERFVRKPPEPPKLTAEVWINPPAKKLDDNTITQSNRYTNFANNVSQYY